MKFSIIIPTQNRPDLAALTVHYALSQKYKDIEVVVSDNSTTDEFKKQNREYLKESIKDPRLVLVSPPKVLSIMDHFEFTLQFARGDYVLFLTDKMMILPSTLDIVAEAIKNTGAEVVNWTYYHFTPEDIAKPHMAGDLDVSEKPLNLGYKEYDPIEELRIKASNQVPRTHLSQEHFATGKICFGCFSKDLIARIILKTGSLYGAATHDYSAMVQALCLAKKCAILTEPGIIIFNLPREKSLGSLTCFYASHGLKYYQSFKDPHLILNSLLVPGLYASQHNMVAYDYLKYLAIYGKSELFNEKNWVYFIGKDLYLSERIWGSIEEKKQQLDLFYSHLSKRLDLKMYYYWKGFRDALFRFKESFFHKTRVFIKSVFLENPLGKKLLAIRKKGQKFTPPPPITQIHFETLEKAYQRINQRQSKVV